MEQQTDEVGLVRAKLAQQIAGEITLADAPEGVIRKWRGIFKISQKDLSRELGTSPSVVSDYESGRRKSPGVKVVRRYVDALLNIDARHGSVVANSFRGMAQTQPLSSAIIDIKEFHKGMSASAFCSAISASVVTDTPVHEIYGYTIIDSLKAITELSHAEMLKLYGLTTQRALIFTKVSTGRTPLIAIKLTNLHPGLVVLHGVSGQLDDVAKRIAEAEEIPVAICRLESIDAVKEGLRKLG